MRNPIIRAALAVALSLGTGSILEPAFAEGVRYPSFPYPDSEFVSPHWADKALQISISLQAAEIIYRCEYRGPNWVSKAIMVGWAFEMELFKRNGVSQGTIDLAKKDLGDRINRAIAAPLSDDLCEKAARYLDTLDSYVRS